MLCRSFWLYALIFLIHMPGSAQAVAPVQWDFKVLSTDPFTTSISLRATLSPGWKLYSQHNHEGGPLPTKITFTPDTRYYLEGITEEYGKRETIYDDDYEMNVSWYEDQVIFIQKIKSEKNDAMIKGNIEYVICNEQLCIPEKQHFSLSITP